MWDNTYTFNEPIYLFNGFIYLKEGHSFNPNHPLLSGIISSVPLIFMDIDIDYPSIKEMKEIGHPWNFARKDWLYYGNNTPNKILVWARLPFIFLALLFGFYIFRWSSEMYGFKSGVFSLILYSFFPYVLGYSSLVSLQGFLSWIVKKGHTPRFVMGQYTKEGLFYYFVALLYTTPIPLMIFALIAIFYSVYNRKRDELFLVVPLIYFLLVIV